MVQLRMLASVVSPRVPPRPLSSWLPHSGMQAVLELFSSTSLCGLFPFPGSFLATFHSNLSFPLVITPYPLPSLTHLRIGQQSARQTV